MNSTTKLLAWHTDEDELDYEGIGAVKIDLDNKGPVIMVLSRSKPEDKWEKVT